MLHYSLPLTSHCALLLRVMYWHMYMYMSTRKELHPCMIDYHTTCTCTCVSFQLESKRCPNGSTQLSQVHQGRKGQINFLGSEDL